MNNIFTYNSLCGIIFSSLLMLGCSEKPSTKTIVLVNFSDEITFDDPSIFYGIPLSQSGKCGSNCGILNNQHEYFMLQEKKIAIGDSLLRDVGASVWIRLMDKNQEIRLVFDHSRNGENLNWISKVATDEHFPVGEWGLLNASFKTDQVKPGDIVKLMVWNKTKKTAHIDCIFSSFSYHKVSSQLPSAEFFYLKDSIHYHSTTPVYSLVKQADVPSPEIHLDLSVKIAVKDLNGDHQDELLTLSDGKITAWYFSKESNSWATNPFSNTQLKHNIQWVNLNSTRTGNFKWNHSELFWDFPFTVFLAQKDSVLKLLDLNSTEPGMNPKFYEIGKLFPGRFFSHQQYHLLFVGLNCCEDSFNGIRCNCLEQNASLLNTIQFYEIPE